LFFSLPICPSGLSNQLSNLVGMSSHDLTLGGHEVPSFVPNVPVWTCFSAMSVFSGPAIRSVFFFKNLFFVNRSCFGPLPPVFRHPPHWCGFLLAFFHFFFSPPPPISPFPQQLLLDPPMVLVKGCFSLFPTFFLGSRNPCEKPEKAPGLLESPLGGFFSSRKSLPHGPNSLTAGPQCIVPPCPFPPCLRWMFPSFQTNRHSHSLCRSPSLEFRFQIAPFFRSPPFFCPPQFVADSFCCIYSFPLVFIFDSKPHVSSCLTILATVFSFVGKAFSALFFP